MTIDFAALAYLNRRGYSPELVLQEDVKRLPPGRHEVAGVEFALAEKSLVFTCRTMSGAVQGLHIASWGGEKRYEWRPSKAKWLPVCYAQPEDWEILYHMGDVILVEGIFDRIALKRCFPARAVVARLSKSVASIEWILKRYAKQVWLAFDQDEEGEKGARRVRYRLAPAGIDVQRLAFLGKDPGEHFETHGLESLRKMVDKKLEDSSWE